MKDFSRIALFGALILLVIVLSQVNVFGHWHWHLGWLRPVLPFLLIFFIVWIVTRGKCCGWGCCSKKNDHHEEEMESRPPSDEAEG